jgi:Transposase DDE domain
VITCIYFKNLFAFKPNEQVFISSILKSCRSVTNGELGAHRVFQGLAQHGKSSTGWFYGLKIHVVINHLGQIVSSVLTSGSVADNNADVLHELLGSIKGKCIGDKGYLTKLFQFFYENGLHLVTKPRKNMKSNAIPLTLQDKKLLNKRGVSNLSTIY